ncbi:MAG: glycosyltransferase, partial [Cyanobacteria bacterium CRU_2_1]|nr:glycosyltransferase [Cyanobacteria bacterium CRU_2_1]
HPPIPLWLSAWIGSILIVLNPQTFLWGRTGVSDMLLSGCMGTALLAFFWGYAQPDRPKIQARWYLAFYVFVALAVLTKGPVGIVLPGLVVTAFLLYVGNGRSVLREMRLLRGSLIFWRSRFPGTFW